MGERSGKDGKEGKNEKNEKDGRYGKYGRFSLSKLVYLEELDNPVLATVREKQLVRMERLRKEVLINRFNPTWEDLSPTLDHLPDPE
ncbi:MAG: GIY-YIG nuclease family protein [Proteobacteria bacterium]|nr:GIY-YIG nuclease family protein [Pseudomonadota bacterium]MDA1301673.1 GIY-YIG nuclease family protein [Pseudomonadota bacterium]